MFALSNGGNRPKQFGCRPQNTLEWGRTTYAIYISLQLFPEQRRDSYQPHPERPHSDGKSERLRFHYDVSKRTRHGLRDVVVRFNSGVTTRNSLRLWRHVCGWLGLALTLRLIGCVWMWNGAWCGKTAQGVGKPLKNWHSLGYAAVNKSTAKITLLSFYRRIHRLSWNIVSVILGHVCSYPWVLRDYNKGRIITHRRRNTPHPGHQERIDLVALTCTEHKILLI